MSLQTESTLPGGIPGFPFQEVSPGGVGMETGAGVTGGAGVKGPPDFVALRSALEAAVRALRSFHDYVGMLEQQEQARRPGVGSGPQAGAGAVVQPSMVLPALPPREVFPSGPREPGVSARAALSVAQQAALDTALAQAFAQEKAPARGVAGAGEAVHFATGGREVGRPEPLPPPSAMPAPPSLMAAAPPLPIAHSPFAQPASAPTGLPSAVAPAERPLGAFSASAFPTEAAAGPGSSAPFSAFHSPAPLVTSPPAPGPEMAAPAPAPAEASWPTSPFFGTTQASTAPFRMVEPPPVIASSAGAPLAAPPPVVAAPAPQAAHAAVPPPSPPVVMHVPAPAPAPVPAPAPPPAAPPPAPPAAAMPREPIPDQGQVFNFAELLRANGQR